jgi:hypothetical protein
MLKFIRLKFLTFGSSASGEKLRVRTMMPWAPSR